VDAVKWIGENYNYDLQMNSPRFTFIDPFGATGAPFSVIRELLAGTSSEILINFDADGVSRIFAASKQNAKNAENLDEVFDEADWRSEFGKTVDHDERSRLALRLFKSQLASVPDVRYVFETEMRDRADNLSYYLVFAG